MRNNKIAENSARAKLRDRAKKKWLILQSWPRPNHVWAAGSECNVRRENPSQCARRRNDMRIWTRRVSLKLSTERCCCLDGNKQKTRSHMRSRMGWETWWCCKPRTTCMDTLYCLVPRGKAWMKLSRTAETHRAIPAFLVRWRAPVLLFEPCFSVRAWASPWFDQESRTLTRVNPTIGKRKVKVALNSSDHLRKTSYKRPIAKREDCVTSTLSDDKHARWSREAFKRNCLRWNEAIAIILYDVRKCNVQGTPNKFHMQPNQSCHLLKFLLRLLYCCFETCEADDSELFCVDEAITGVAV